MDTRGLGMERALFQSLVSGPVLVGGLPEAPVFPHASFEIPAAVPSLCIDQKLGHLYEDVLAELVEATARYDLIGRNIQIQASRHETLGELDFLIRDHDRSELIHLELATKFYLGVNTSEGLQLPGPDTRDNYFRKLRHLRENQLSLSERHRGRLPEDLAGEQVVRRQLVYGCIFDHIASEERARPSFLHAKARRGCWLSLDELEGFAGGARLERIPKHLWPVPLEMMADLALPLWEVPGSLVYCTMLRIEGRADPCFVTPSGYPGCEID